MHVSPLKRLGIRRPGGTTIAPLTKATARLQRILQDATESTMPDWVQTPVARGERAHPSPPGSDAGQFVAATFRNEAGTRPYKLFVPGGYADDPAPLVVMLHGCTQSADDFAAGTRMNLLAEADGFLVVYPEQTSAANTSKCWNWFNTADQRRDHGEASLIAGITRDVMARHAIDGRRVYVAGMSAGGAAAAIMGAAYPDLYAAIGVHSGLACGAASNLASAYAAMRSGHDGSGRRPIPAIVFTGDRDTTVNPANADAVIAQSAPDDRLRQQAEEGRVPGGHAYTRTRYVDADGISALERWVVHGAGHAWSGGSPAGSYTDPGGPDATGAMLRFFRDHPKR